MSWTRSSPYPVSPSLTAEEINWERVKGSKYLHTTASDPVIHGEIVRKAKQFGIRVSIDPETVKQGVEKVLSLADICIAPLRFATDLTGKEDPALALASLAEYGPEVCGVTCGREGSFILEAGKPVHIPAFNVNVLDTTGVGDVYHGAFLHALCQGFDVRSCAVFASAVSAIKCTARRMVSTFNVLKYFLRIGSAFPSQR